MFTILATKEEVFHDYPQVTEWIEIAEKLTGKDINVDKVEFLYSYGFFHPKVEDKEKYYTELFEKCSKMEYNQRVEFELSKVRVELTLKVGQFVLSNRIKDFLPQIISIVVNHILDFSLTWISLFHAEVVLIFAENSSESDTLISKQYCSCNKATNESVYEASSRE